MHPSPPTKSPRSALQFALPSSLGPGSDQRAAQLQQYLEGVLGRPVSVVVSQSYEQLGRDVLSGRCDAAWAPPFVCARLEAMGVRMLLRGVRQGSSTYRAALVARRASDLSLQNLNGASVAWSDRDSVGGFLLAHAFLRELGIDPAKTFAKQTFVGSYLAALEAVEAGMADLTSVFASAPHPGRADVTAIEEFLPGRVDSFRVLAFTREAPNDGVAVSMNAAPQAVTDLEKSFLGLHHSASGKALLESCFHMERFEVAPRMGYRALYRVALASL